jgi:hypothetical protein
MHHAKYPSAAKIVVALIAIPIACGAGCRETIHDPSPVTVHAVPLAEEEVFSGMRFSATVKERHRVELSFKVNDLVKELR